MTFLSKVLPVRRPIAVLTIAFWMLPSIPVWSQAPSPATVSGIKITVKEGDGALNNIRTLRAREPVVVVTDTADRPLAGAQVTFLLPEMGASGMFAASGTTMIVTTGADGVAVGRGLKPNNVVGQFQIRVAASYQGGQTARATITQTNAAPKSSGNGTKTALIVALIGGARAAAAIGLTRGGNNSQPAGTSISAGGSTFGPPQ
jgi:hypothetical protein